jgi:5-methylcytosine-specific restriction endonuclease McrA
MATINKNRIRPKHVDRICSETFNSATFYNSLAWKRFRNVYASEHPVCEECLRHSHVEPTGDIHHIIPFSTGSNEAEQWKLFLDPKNVMALCEACHVGYHIKMKRYGLQRCDGLTEKEYREAHSQL